MATKRKKRSGPGRPPIDVNWKLIDSLCGIQCSRDEIVAVLGVSADTLLRRCKSRKGVTLEEYMDAKRAPGRVSLRRRQLAAAKKGSIAMLIWLGKNWLGQRDQPEVKMRAGDVFQLITHGGPPPETPPDAGADEREATAQRFEVPPVPQISR